MPIEYVTRGVSFDNLLVEAKAVRWICDDCGRREAFHDTPPYGETVETPSGRGWQIVTPWNDGEEGARCAKCVADLRAREPPSPDPGKGAEVATPVAGQREEQS